MAKIQNEQEHPSIHSLLRGFERLHVLVRIPSIPDHYFGFAMGYVAFFFSESERDCQAQNRLTPRVASIVCMVALVSTMSLSASFFGSQCRIQRSLRNCHRCLRS